MVVNVEVFDVVVWVALMDVAKPHDGVIFVELLTTGSCAVAVL